MEAVHRPLRLNLANLPGGDLILAGLSDLERGEPTPATWLLQIGRPRLSRLGFDIASRAVDPSPERALYELLAAEFGDGAHARFNALIRRLVSFERAAQCAIRSTVSASID